MIRDSVYPYVHIGIKSVQIFNIFVIMVIFDYQFIVIVGFLCKTIEALYPALHAVDGKGLFGK
jgi:hypothetical protein